MSEQSTENAPASGFPAAPPPPPPPASALTAQPSSRDFEDQFEDMIHELRAIKHATTAMAAKGARVSLGIVVTLAILWGAAESHDTNCYTKATIRALAAAGNGQEPTSTGCLILPWNKP